MIKHAPKLLAALIAFAFPGLGTTAHATMIGDTVSISHYIPGVVSPFVTYTTFVTTGPSDGVTLFGEYRVNPEASQILIRFLDSVTYDPVPANGYFNGVGVSGINDTITGATVFTNMVGWNASRLSFTNHAILANWAGLSVNAGPPTGPTTFFNISLTLIPTPAPDASTSFGLLALGAIVLVGFRRKFV